MIETIHGQFYFELFYVLAIITGSLIFLFNEKMSKMVFGDRLLILTFAILFLIIGSKIFTYAPNDWNQLFSTGEIPEAPGKTILGGLAGALIGIFLAKKIIGTNVSIADGFAIAFPIGMAIQRIGCLLVGCCYGSPTHLPWGITYGESHMAYHNHQNNGWIESVAEASLPVHPNQLYQIIFCVLVSVLVHHFRNRFKRKDNLFLFSITLYLVSRFFIEFSRDGFSNNYVGNEYFHLKLVQWIVLSVILFFAICIYLREKKSNPVQSVVRDEKRSLLLLLLLTILLFNLRNWLSVFELSVIELFFLPLILLRIKTAFRFSIPDWNKKILQSLLVINVIFLGGMVFAQNTESINVKKEYHDFRLGYGYTELKYYHQSPIVTYHAGAGCSPGYNTYSPNGPFYNNEVKTYGFDYRFTKIINEKENFSANFRTSFGKLTSENPDRLKQTIGSIAANINYDSKWIGLGIGIGKAKIPVIYKTVFWYNHDGRLHNTIYINYYFRLFPMNVISVTARSTSTFPITEIQKETRNYMPLEALISTDFNTEGLFVMELGMNTNNVPFFGFNFPFMQDYLCGVKYYFPRDEIHTGALHLSLGYRLSR